MEKNPITDPKEQRETVVTLMAALISTHSDMAIVAKKAIEAFEELNKGLAQDPEWIAQLQREEKLRNEYMSTISSFYGWPSGIGDIEEASLDLLRRVADSQERYEDYAINADERRRKGEDVKIRDYEWNG